MGYNKGEALKLLYNGLSELSISCSTYKAELMMGYMEAVLDKNREFNLTAITDPRDFVLKNIIDSLSIAGTAEYKAARDIVDIGSGAGFPAVPLAILSEDKEFALVDSLEKRIRFIEETTYAMGLENIIVIHARAEELGQDEEYREYFDLSIARAVADLSVLSEYCLPMTAIGGAFIAYKGPDPDVEIESAGAAISELGGDFDRYETVEIVENRHTLVAVRKVSPTPSKYPRRPGKPSKSPICFT